MDKTEQKFARIIKTFEEKINALEQRPDTKELVENLQKDLAELKDTVKQDQLNQSKLAEVEELKVKFQELEGYLKSGAKFIDGIWQMPKKEREPKEGQEPEQIKKEEPDKSWFL